MRLPLYAVAFAVVFCTSAAAQSTPSPTWTPVGGVEKAYGETTSNWRGLSVGPDFWFPGHKRNMDGPYLRLSNGSYTQTRGAELPYRQSDGSGGDRHECGAMDLNQDGKDDLICTHGADQGTGIGETELFRNISTATKVEFQRLDWMKTGLNSGDAPYGRKRSATFFKRADGRVAVWIATQGERRADGKSNMNRLFVQTVADPFKFTEYSDFAVNREHYSSCTRSGDLNGDGLDDLLMCRDFEWDYSSGQNEQSPAGSIVYYQNADNSFTASTLPQIAEASVRWRTARIIDWDGDGRNDIVASVTGKSPRVAVFLQKKDGAIRQTASLSVATPTISNSVAVGDLNGDGKLDMYVTQSYVLSCQKEAGSTGSMTDTWPDIVVMSQASGGYLDYNLNMEPTANGCSWLATYVGGRRVHLARGLEGAPGQGYVVQFP